MGSPEIAGGVDPGTYPLQQLERGVRLVFIAASLVAADADGRRLEADGEAELVGGLQRRGQQRFEDPGGREDDLRAQSCAEDKVLFFIKHCFICF